MGRLGTRFTKIGLGCAFLACLIATSAAPAAAQSASTATDAATPRWQSYRYARDGFTVQFPAPPQMSRSNIGDEDEPLELHTYTVELSKVAMLVAVCDYGQDAAGSDPASLLEEAKKGILDRSGAHLQSEQKITLGAYQGIGLEAESGSTHLSIRLYLVGNRFYQMSLAYPAGGAYPDAARFMDSFALLTGPQG